MSGQFHTPAALPPGGNDASASHINRSPQMLYNSKLDLQK